MIWEQPKQVKWTTTFEAWSYLKKNIKNLHIHVNIYIYVFKTFTSFFIGSQKIVAFSPKKRPSLGTTTPFWHLGKDSNAAIHGAPASCPRLVKVGTRHQALTSWMDNEKPRWLFLAARNVG